MRRFALDDNPRQRKRPMVDLRATGFLTNLKTPKASASAFLTPLPQSSSTLPFTFAFKKRPAQPSNGLHAWAQETRGGQSSILTGVVGLSAQKFAEALQKPFHGVALDDAKRKTSVASADTGIGTGALDDETSQDTAVDDPPPLAQPTEPSISKRIRKLWNDFPILPWMLKWREFFLREFLRLDGRAEALGLMRCTAPDCQNLGFPDHRCEDCRGANFCQSCAVFWHTYSPLHKIERYNESGFYERVTAADLGMHIQLMHPPGEDCPFRSCHSVANFKIIHTNGIHVITVFFCKCAIGRDVPPPIQLMRRRFWPATCENPQTATTFEALDLFTRLTALGRLNMYDFSRALEAATDGAMLRGIASVRQQFSTCARQFRHILMFKRAGRGHEPGGIQGTPSGACAVRCPACPNFDLNVPKDWALSPFRWLYRVILAMDANFRLSNKLTRSTTDTDPNLTDGRAYMAPWEDYAAHLLETNKELAQESTCSRFSALELANQRGGKGQRSTGVAACICARHEFVQPTGVAALRKGERYETMDWVLCGALSHVRATEVTVSYDVVCQYFKKLGDRMAQIPPTRIIWAGAQAFAKFTAEGNMSYVVPKFHLYAHKAYCQLRFAFGWLLGTAVTDGEAPERLWSNTNAAASSLREMGPGGNNDTMDDMFGAWNWMKTCSIGSALCGRMDRALDEGDMQTEIQTELTAALVAQYPDRMAHAQESVKTWQTSDQSKIADTDCPYYSARQGLSIAQIKLQSEEAQGSTCDAAHDETHEDVALAQCLLRGLQIEAERARIATKHDDECGTIKQATARTQALNALVRAIVDFRAEQEITMPVTYAALTTDERDPERKVAMTVNLCMPSDPPDGDKSLVTATARAIEAKLRWAAMVDELDNLLQQLRLKGCLHKHRVAHVTGQRAGTRALAAQAAVNVNVKKAANAYRRHRAAYFALVGEGSWQETMRELRDSDCRGLGDRLVEQMEKMSQQTIKSFLEGRHKADSSGETSYKLPWIWYNWSEKSGAELTDELITEWAKSYARAQHWVHEVRLVDAEMQRVIDFSKSMAQIWNGRREPEATIDLGEGQGWAGDAAWVDGIRAYASKQAFIREAQATKWTKEFADLRTEAGRFLTVHTDDGLSLDPITLLPATEVEDMRRRTLERRKRRTKAKDLEKADAEPEPADDDPFEGDAKRDGALNATTADLIGDAKSNKKTPKASTTRTDRAPGGVRKKRGARKR